MAACPGLAQDGLRASCRQAVQCSDDGEDSVFACLLVRPALGGWAETGRRSLSAVPMLTQRLTPGGLCRLPAALRTATSRAHLPHRVPRGGRAAALCAECSRDHSGGFGRSVLRAQDGAQLFRPGRDFRVPGQLPDRAGQPGR